jgi:CBS domain-containing protein
LPRIIAPVQIGDVMTDSVVTASRGATVGEVAELMRDRNVGSVVICDDEGHPHALITDRDVALSVADSARRDSEADQFASHPLVTGEAEMDLEEAAALMVQHRIRRLPVLADGSLRGIVTLDDLAVRVGDPALAQQMTSAVARAALPEFYFHQRGG